MRDNNGMVLKLVLRLLHSETVQAAERSAWLLSTSETPVDVDAEDADAEEMLVRSLAQDLHRVLRQERDRRGLKKTYAGDDDAVEATTRAELVKGIQNG